MKSFTLIRLLGATVAAAAGLGAVAACTVNAEVAPLRAPDGGADAAPVAVDAGTDAPPVTTLTCPAPPSVPSCGATQAAPTGKSAVQGFVKESAVPIRCGTSDTDATWDLRHLVALYGAQKMFMVGEVHGSNEIGIVSSVILDALGTKKLVNVVGYEFPNDFEPYMQAYVDGQSSPDIEQYLKQMPPNMFAAILTEKARELTKAGHPMTIAAVDIPAYPESPHAEIVALAAKLTNQKSTVLETLPDVQTPPQAADFAKVNAYFDHIANNKTQICAELSADDCDALNAQVHAFWASTLAYDESEAQSQLWFARREEAIYYNMHHKMRSAGDRMFLHMGAFHTNKGAASAGSRMAHEYAETKDRVFSIGPAYGDGSVIHYGEDMDLPGSPQTVVDALTHVPSHPLYVPLNQPSAACVKNPLGLEPDEGVVGGDLRMGELYDGLIHYGKLTSEASPKKTTFVPGKPLMLPPPAMSARVKALTDFRARIERRERAALSQGAVRGGVRFKP